MRYKPFRWLATKWYGWVALAVLTILIAWLTAPEWIEAGGYSITRAILELANYSPIGVWDFSGGTIKLEGGACPPAATGCDSGTGAEEKRVWVCDNTQDIYACFDDSIGWKITRFDQDAAYQLISGDWFFGGDVDMLSATAVKIALLDEPGQDLNIQFNTAAERKLHITNIGAGDGNLGVVGDITIDQSATATDAILNFKTSGAGTGTVKLDDSTDSLDSYHDGTLATQTRTDHWIPPACPADLNTVSFGGVCAEVSTGKIRYRGVLEAIP